MKILKSEFELIRELKQYGNCKLYGAGVAGQVLLDELLDLKMTVDLIVVSDFQGNPDNIYGIPVKAITEVLVDEHDIIVVGTLSRNHDKIEKTLLEFGYTKIYAISDDLYRILRLKRLDLTPELLQNQRQILSNQKHLFEMLDSINSRFETFYYGKETCKIERKFYENSFTDEFWNSVSFESMLLALLKNLDENSIDIILVILNRIKRIQTEQDCFMFDFFTENEISQIQRILKEFFQGIYKISDKIWCYKGCYLPINHFEPGIFYYKHGIDKLTTISKIVDKDIVDAGAYIGDSSLILSPLTNKNVYAFEASKDNYNMIYDTIKLNGINNIVPVHYALGDKNQEVDLIMGEKGSCLNSINGISIAETYGIEKVQQITLDEFVEKNNIKIGLIKSDVEGAEMKLLMGAINTIKTQKPILMISIYHSAQDFFLIKTLIESWNLGYQFKIYKPDIGTIAIDTMLFAEIIDEA